MGIYEEVAPKKVEVEIQKHQDGHLDEVGFLVRSSDGSDLTAQQIMDAIGEALLWHYEYFTIETIKPGDLDS